MQHVLRCWKRQSDRSEYKKTLRRPGLRPGPRWGSLQRSRKVGGEGLAVPSPRTPTPALGPSGLASPTPTPKLVPTLLGMQTLNILDTFAAPCKPCSPNLRGPNKHGDAYPRIVWPRTTKFSVVAHLVELYVSSGSGTTPYSKNAGSRHPNIFGTFYVHPRGRHTKTKFCLTVKLDERKILRGWVGRRPRPRQNFLWYEYWPRSVCGIANLV